MHPSSRRRLRESRGAGVGGRELVIETSSEASKELAMQGMREQRTDPVMRGAKESTSEGGSEATDEVTE